MHKTTVNLPEDDYRRANLLSAAMGLSVGELLRCSLKATLLTAEDDPNMKVAFELSAKDVRTVMAGRLGGMVETR